MANHDRIKAKLCLKRLFSSKKLIETQKANRLPVTSNVGHGRQGVENLRP